MRPVTREGQLAVTAYRDQGEFLHALQGKPYLETPSLLLFGRQRDMHAGQGAKTGSWDDGQWFVGEGDGRDLGDAAGIGDDQAEIGLAG